jgi:creatinine amidohydrolase
LPLGFDALKASALCVRIARKTGGVVLPASYHGFAGGHRDYAGSILFEEDAFVAHLRTTLVRLADMGFKVIVVLTGHYPVEQVDAVKRIAEGISRFRPGVQVIGLAEYEAFPGEMRADHAAKWETSIAMHLMPELVRLKAMERHDDPLYGIYGEDPRIGASAELGRETVDMIVDTVAGRVRDALRTQV